MEFTTPEVVNLYFALKNRGFESDMEKFDGHMHVDIVFERPKLHIEVDGIQHNQSTRQVLSDLKRTFYSMQDGFLTIRIPNILVRNELTETVNYLVELILERYYKHM
jgi:very-short-patch-repair endonuclease